MLKNYRIIKKIGAEVSEAAESAANSVLNDYSNLKGREEEITAQLRGEINRNLARNIEERLGNKDINGCKFSVATFKKKQEKGVGADLAGVVELSLANRTISKAFLAQAKIGNFYEGPRGINYIKAYNKDIVRQAEDMLKITSDSFFFLYSTRGIHCVSALQVLLSGSKTIDTGHHPFHTFGSFYQEFFKCFIGDHLISPAALGAKDLEDYAEKVNAETVMKLSVQLKSAD
ncbi:hypothetical protein ACT3TQ_14520 [Halomonas sp. AOP12-C2-37]|uniref:hypothetical protein n=1 Tax=unclassified Halomonas TaxID=2609666 RepID=UPI0040337BE3